MFECEVLAIYRAFQQADSFAREKGGVAKNICIFVDNLEAKLRIEACLAKKHGSTILEILSGQSESVRKFEIFQSGGGGAGGGTNSASSH